MLVTVPLGLFVSATVFDLARVASGWAFLGEVGFWTAVAGLVAAGLAAVAGLLDLCAVPVGALWRTAVRFNLATVAMAGVFLCVCLVRAGVDRTASGWLLPLELAALAAGVAGARFGARLVRQSGVEPEPAPPGRPMRLRGHPGAARL